MSNKFDHCGTGAAYLFAAIPSDNDNEAETLECEAAFYEALRAPLRRSVIIAEAGGADDTYWRNMQYDALESVLSNLKTPDPRNHQKDGKSFVPGSLKGGAGATGKRIIENVAALEMLVLDFDNGRPYQPIAQRADARGLRVLIVPTFNNMRPETEIKTDKLVKWVKAHNGAHGTLSPHDEATPEQALAYFREHVLPEYADGAKFKGRRGRVYVVSHRPYPRFRVFVPLDKAANVADIAPTNAGAKEKWRTFYEHIARDVLGAPDFDASCTDITRLFYYNRQPEGVKGWHIETEGAALDTSLLYGPIEAIPGYTVIKSEKPNRAHGDTHARHGDENRRDWIVSGVGALARACMETGGFRFADFARDYGHNARDNGRGGVEAYCFNQEAHTDEDDESELKLYAYNPGDSTAPHGVMKCNHNGCSQTASSWVHVDLIADVNDLTVDDLIEYAVDPAAVRESMTATVGPPDAPGNVVLTSDWETNVRNAKAALVEVNSPAPTLFYSTFGGTLRLNTAGDLPALQRVETQKRWRQELESRVKFWARDREDNWHTVPAKRELIDRVSEDHELALPQVEGISSLPSFARDGTLQTANGYDPKRKVYQHATVKFAPIEDHPDDARVQWAARLLDETLCEYCPTDVDGVDPLPPRLPERDPVTGLWVANPERGKSSRAVLEAMMFAPLLVDACGPQPAFAIDKYSNGEGAGAVLAMMGILMTGDALEPTTLPRDEVELKKLITSVVAVGAPWVAFDNVPLGHVVASESLAASLIDRRWTDRRLQSSDIVTGPLRQQFYFSGLNLQIHRELKRRMLRVKLHSGFMDPSADRPDDWFTHTDFRAWLKDNRLRIIEALQILVRAWYARGQIVPADAKGMDSYTGFARTVQGIQAMYGRTGLLDTWHAWLKQEAGSGEDTLRLDAVRMLADAFMLAPFTGQEAFEALGEQKQIGGGGLAGFGGETIYTGKLNLPLPVKTGAPQTTTAALKDYLQTVAVGIPVDTAGTKLEGVAKRVALDWDRRKRKFRLMKVNADGSAAEGDDTE